ncbi:response regulator transcription factor [Chloroflexota bacterium]
MASALFISENTVKTHLRNIMNKLGVANRSQVAVYAVKGNTVRE